MLRILHIEDDELIAAMIARHLADFASEDVQLELARNMQEARSLLTGGSEYDVLLVDLGLPGFSGIETIAAVRDVAPHHPLVVFTGADDPENILAIAAAQLGVISWFEKGQAHPTDILRCCLMHQVYSATCKLRNGLRP